MYMCVVMLSFFFKNLRAELFFLGGGEGGETEGGNIRNYLHNRKQKWFCINYCNYPTSADRSVNELLSVLLHVERKERRKKKRERYIFG